MAFDKRLYTALYNLRIKIKDDARFRGERAPAVCSDEALAEMATLCPKKISDFEGINGIGKAFCDNYAEEFLKVILSFSATENEREVEISERTLGILRELEKKLVSINRRNRLLYMPKLSSKYAYDLFLSGVDKIERIIYDRAGAVICSVEDLPPEKLAEEKAKYKKIVSVLREANKDLREKGRNDLYIGFPFAVGALTGEDFPVRAPLALFPVKANRTATEISLAFDDSRDIIYNTTLILANYKFNNVSAPLPTETIEETARESFFSSLCNFYGENGLKIKQYDSAFIKFTEYTQSTFPSFTPGELYTEACAVLGKFPVCGSSIQKDFDEIIKSNTINALVGGLLAEGEDVDFYSEEETEAPCATDVSEESLIYINDINSSQEAVLAACERGDRLVVQGPPGTGKSQTITSLIADFAIKGKTVLMVSEKKTALDVVYSRLGNLSKYALIIDDTGNKNAFYDQLSNMIVQRGKESSKPCDTASSSAAIDGIMKKFEAIAEKLYKPDASGTEPYRLYLFGPRLDMNDTETRQKLILIKKNRSASLSDARFPDVEASYNFFKEGSQNVRLREFFSLDTAFPWISSLREGIDGYSLISFEQELSELFEEYTEWQKKSFLLRLFTKGKLMKKAREISEKYFVKKTKETENLILEKGDKICESLASYETYYGEKPLYDSLSSTSREYLVSVIKISDTLGFSFEDATEELMRELVCERISIFEAQNRAVIADIDGFEENIGKISRCMQEKKLRTRTALSDILAKDMEKLTASKRHGEILRVLESKRKWSVNKFIKKFDFEIFKSVRIWLLTPEVVSEIIPLQTGLFDIVIFDEASQMYVEKGIPSILRAKKAVIAGDHKQLRPSSLGAGRLEADTELLAEDDEVAAALEEESLLDLARFRYDDVMLSFHYRSKYEELIAFSNYAFYHGKLCVSPNCETPLEPPITVHMMEDALWKDRTNEKEARHIVSLLKDFFKTRRDGETVGIITFNSDQRDLIDDLIDEERARDAEFDTAVRDELSRRRDGEDIGLFVKNIESVQGDERDVIIFSIGYAKNEAGKLVRNFGWLNQRGGENRLNVAISRAKKKVHIVTSFNPSELEVDDMKNDGPRILRKYLEYAAAVSNGDRESAKRILLSLGTGNTGIKEEDEISILAREISNALNKRGYETEFNVGIGGYTIDMAVKRDGKYVLGIECDSGLYEKSDHARERDYHRQKYLTSRGWKIYRAWSRNWWNDCDGETEKLCRMINSQNV